MAKETQNDRQPDEKPMVADGEIKRARKRAAVSIFLNILLSLGKGTAGVVGGSAALIGDAIHSATDVIGSAAAYFGLWVAGKKHPSFPYGLYKAETLATLITSIAVILAGYEIGRQAVLGPESIPDVSLTLPVALASLVLTFSFGIYQLRAGRKLHSKALEADARDYLADALSTSVVVLSLLGAYYGFRLDRWAAGAVSLFVFWSGGKLLWRATCDLLDEAIDRDSERQIISLVSAHPRVTHVERCMSRTAGGRFIVDLDVIFRSHSLEDAHRIAHILEEEIIRQFPRVVMASIKTHSHRPEQIHRMTPVKSPDGEVEPHMPVAPWFLMETVDRRSGSVLDQEYIQNPHYKAKSKKGFLVGRWLLGFKPDQVVIIDDKNESTAIELLREAGVELVLSTQP